MTETLSFHSFGPEHLEGALRLSRATNWPHRPEDWSLVLGLSRGVVALADERVVATALATPFGDIGMVNMIIVDETMRGRGLGREIMTRAMALIEPQEWRLVATQSGLPLYEKLGFVACGMVLQYQGQIAELAPPQGIRWAGPEDLAAIIEMDRAATGAERSALISSIVAAGRVAVAPGKGFAILRPFGRGEVAGPVIADDPETARKLLTMLFAGRAGSFMRVDTTGDTGLETWLAGIGLAEVDRGVAMRRGQVPAPDGKFTRYSLAAQALG